MGASDKRIIFKHLIPNALGSLIVWTTLAAATAIILEASLTYLGFGVNGPTRRRWAAWCPTGCRPPRPGPGSSTSRASPCLIIVLSINLIGDGIRDAFDRATAACGPEGHVMTITNTADAGAPLLAVEDLNVRFPTEDGLVHAVRGVDYSLRSGEVLGIVGESGSGKSVTSLAVMGLLPASARVTGSVKYRGQELLGLGDRAMSRVRGKGVSMIFQDPMTSLDPVYRWGSRSRRRCGPTTRACRPRPPRPGPPTCSPWSASRTRRSGCAPTRTSSPAACASAWSSPSPWPTSPT